MKEQFYDHRESDEKLDEIMKNLFFNKNFFSQPINEFKKYLSFSILIL